MTRLHLTARLLPALLSAALIASGVASAHKDHQKPARAASSKPAMPGSARAATAEDATASRPGEARGRRAPGRTHRVPADHVTLQAAILAAAPFDTIEVAPGRYMESLVLSGAQRGLVLRASGGAEETRLVGGGDARILTFDEVDTLVTVIGFTLEGGHPQFDGGAIYAYRSRVDLQRCVFRSNETPGDGGAAAFYESEARLLDCRIEGNSARRGGGVFVAGSRVALERNVISGNVAELEGGGIFCVDSPGAGTGSGGTGSNRGTSNGSDSNHVTGNRPDDSAGCAPAPPLPPNPHR